MNGSATETKPPYGGFRTFWNFIGQLHENRPLPQVLDKAVMGNRGGSARTELYGALRFLGLIDEDKRPTAALRTLTDDYTIEALRPLIEESYAAVIALDLTTATPSQVGNKLAELGATPSTVERARTFFLNAAQETGIDVGNTLRTARAPSTPRRRAPRRTRTTETENDKTGTTKKFPKMVEGLIERLPEDGQEWTGREAEQWLSLARDLFAYSYDFSYEREGP